MTPAKVNLTAYAGDNWQFSAEMWEDSDKTIAHDLSVYTEIEVQIRPTRDDPTEPPLVSGKLSEGEMSISGVGSNKLSVNIPGDKMKIPGGKYEYDVQGSTATDIQTLHEGRVTITSDVVRSST